MVIGILGGTFDPVHDAHLQMALEAKRTLVLDQVRLVPCHRPPHRDSPLFTSLQRLELLKLATESMPDIMVDDRELHRDRASYTVDTLLSFRHEYGEDCSLVLLMGMDAYSHLNEWFQWQQLRKLAHIAVMTRPDTLPPQQTVLADWLASKDALNIVHKQAAGGLVLLQQSMLSVSATSIREQLTQGLPVTNVPPKVAEYLQNR